MLRLGGGLVAACATALAGVAAMLVFVGGAHAGTNTVTYLDAGVDHQFPLPDGVPSFDVDLLGGSGALASADGGRGALVTGTLDGTNVAALSLRVGTDGLKNEDPAGGGGGGATRIAKTQGVNCDDAIAVAAGGGGAGDPAFDGTGGVGGHGGLSGTAGAGDDGSISGAGNTARGGNAGADGGNNDDPPGNLFGDGAPGFDHGSSGSEGQGGAGGDGDFFGGPAGQGGDIGGGDGGALLGAGGGGGGGCPGGGGGGANPEFEGGGGGGGGGANKTSGLGTPNATVSDDAPFAQIAWAGDPHTSTDHKIAITSLEESTGPDDKENDTIISGVAPTGLGNAPIVAVNGTRTGGGSFSLSASVNPATKAWTLSPPHPDPFGSLDGEWSIRVTQSFGSENSRSHEIVYRLDTTEPVPDLDVPANGSADDEPRPTFSGTTDTPEGTIIVKITGPADNPTTRTRTATRNGTSFSAVLAAGDALADGFYTAVAEQTDLADNVGTSTPPNTFQVDTNDPEVTLDEPDAGDFVTTSRPTISGTADTDAGSNDPLVTLCPPGTSLPCTNDAITFPAPRQPDGSFSLAVPDNKPALSEGTWTIRVTQTDAAGNDDATPPTHTFKVDTLTPAPTLTVLDLNQGFTSNTAPTFKGTGGNHPDDNDSVTVKIYAGAVVGDTPVREFNATLNGTNFEKELPNPLVNDGEYTAVVEQSDAAGHTGVSAPPITFTLDRADPDPVLDPVPNGPEINDRTPTFSGTAGTALGDNTTTLDLVIDPVGGVALPALPATIQPDGTFSVTPGTELLEGNYTAHVEQNDAAGNTGPSNTIAFTVDVTPPKVTLEEFDDGKITGVRDPRFRGTGEEDLPVFVTVYKGPDTSGDIAGEGLGDTREENGVFVFDVPLLAELPADGEYTAQAVQTDRAGNSGPSTPPFTFIVDTVGPDVSVTTPASGAVLGDDTPEIVGVAEPGLVTVDLFQGGSATGQPDRSFETTANAVGQYSVTVDIGLPDDRWTARASQVDRAGNIGESNAVPFVIDTGPPVVTLEAPGDSGATTEAAPELKGTAEEGPVTVSLHAGSTVTGAAVRTLQATAGSDGRYAVRPDPPLSDGAYAAIAEQEDAAGNGGSSSPIEFVVDATAPAITLNSPRDNTFLPTARPTVSGVAGTAARDGESVHVVLSGPTTVTFDTRRAADGAFAVVPPTNLPDGRYVVSATQRDALGNTGSAGPVDVTLDTKPPTGVISTGPVPILGAGTRNVRILFGADEAVRFECRFDGEPMRGVCATPLQLRRLRAGEHVLEIHTIDLAGNRDPDPPVLAFTIDVAAPNMFVAQRIITSRSGRVTLRLTCPSAQARGPCAGTVTPAAGGKRLVSEPIEFEIPLGRRANVSGQLTDSARRTLRRRGSLRMDVRMVAADGRGNVGRRTFRRTLVAPGR